MASSVASRQQVTGMTGRPAPLIRPGVCFPWEEKVKEFPSVTGDRDLIKKVWEDIDALGAVYIYQLLESF